MTEVVHIQLICLQSFQKVRFLNHLKDHKVVNIRAYFNNNHSFFLLLNRKPTFQLDVEIPLMIKIEIKYHCLFDLPVADTFEKKFKVVQFLSRLIPASQVFGLCVCVIFYLHCFSSETNTELRGLMQ